jgi:hypothetical protein
MYRITLTLELVSSMKTDVSELGNDIVLQWSKANHFRVA